MERSIARRVINIFLIIVTLAVNGMANALPLNGQMTGAISDRFKVYFVPAGYVFAIWGIIYVGLIAFGIYQALPAQHSNQRLRRIDYPFMLSCVANSVWIFMWHYSHFTLSLLVMLILLLSLLAIYVLLDIGRVPVKTVERWCVDIPFSIYLGWITVATIANATDALDNLGWHGGPIAPEVWAVIMLVAALAITCAVITTRHDIAYSLVIIWATLGIAVKQWATPLVAYTALLVAIVVAVVLVAMLWRGRGKVAGAAAT
jgi:benzodiazapine receptor